jgi:hypothetical protein
LAVLCGAAATVPMSGTMLLLHQVLPGEKNVPLPPDKITQRVRERLHPTPRTDKRHGVLTVAGHFGFGALAGGLYGLALAGSKSSPTRGIVFGLLIWLLSYQGWLPALGLFPPVANQSRERNFLMASAHGVWGMALGAMHRSITAGPRGERRPAARVTDATE